METQRFKPTTAWLEQHYYDLNEELFGGELGPCSFAIFTTGRGSMGRTLGRFKLEERNLRVSISSRRIIYGNISVDAERFYQICKPSIQINGNYTWTEEALTNTLVHEMCHYQTYMYGTCPKQAHGPEFRWIAYQVSLASKGRITIQRLASAEKMSQLELDSEIAEKNQRRADNKKSKMMALFIRFQNGIIELTTTTSQNLIDHIIDGYKQNKYPSLGPVQDILISNDADLINLLFQHGYKKSMRTYRAWDVTNKPWINDLNKFDMQTLYKSNDITENKNMAYLPKLIKEVINDFLSQETDDTIPIDPNANLGLESPLELTN